MKKFYQVSHNDGQDAKVILANTRYEAIGFYLFEQVEYINANSLDEVKVLQSDYEVETSCNGFSEKKKILEIWKEKDEWISPQVVINLVSTN